jgi:predicted esterase YcpF (UPF0227 family)
MSTTALIMRARAQGTFISFGKNVSKQWDSMMSNVIFYPLLSPARNLEHKVTEKPTRLRGATTRRVPKHLAHNHQEKLKLEDYRHME